MYLDGGTDRARHWAAIRVDRVDALNRFPHCLRRAELVVDGDPADDKDVAIGLNFAHRF
jgi:hypothetical protein